MPVERPNHRSDIFSLGTILYEMLSGRHPFRADTTADTIGNILRSDPPEIESEAVGGSLKKIVDRCLSKDPKARFSSAAELAAELRELLAE